MISVIRRQFKGLAYKFVLWITILALAGVFSVPILFKQSGRGAGPWAVKVNRHEISYNDFVREVAQQRDLLAAIRSQYGQYADLLLASMGMDTDPKALAFNALVREELLNQFANSLGINVHPDQIANQLHNPTFIQQELSSIVPPDIFGPMGTINQQLLKVYLKRRGLSVDWFERKVERIINNRMVLDIITSTVYIPTEDLKEKYITDYAPKKFSILELSIDKLLAQEKAILISEEQLAAFFEKENSQSKRYVVGEKRAGTSWKFGPQSYAIEITDEQINRYYEDNKTKLFLEAPTKVEVRHIFVRVADEASRLALRAKAEQIRNQLLADPSQFAHIAQTVSDDKETASAGGRLAPFARNEKEKAFEKTAFLLPEDGAISEVVQTKDGYEIIQRISKQAPLFKPLKKVKNEIKEKLKLEVFKELFVKDMKQIAQEHNFEEREAALQKLISAHGGKAESVALMAKDDSAVAQHLFKLAIDEIGFYVESGIGIALKTTEIQPSYVPTLASVKETVVADLHELRAQESLNKQVEAIFKEAASGASLDELATRFNAKVEQTEWIDPTDKKVVEKYQKKGVPIAQMLQLAREGASIPYVTETMGYIGRLDGIGSFDQAQFNSKKQDITEALTNARMRLMVEGFVASLYRNATIEPNESLINI